MNTREEFEKWYADLAQPYHEDFMNTPALGVWAYKGFVAGYESCQELNDARRASQKEYYEMVMQDGGKRIAKLEEKLRVAMEALEHYANRKNWHKDSQQYGLYEVSDYNILYNDFYEQNQATRYAGNKAREALKTIEG